MSVEGIDVSEHSENIDWNKVKSQGIHFAFARVNYGGNRKDTNFSSYWSAIKAAGIIRGAYFFFFRLKLLLLWHFRKDVLGRR